MATNFLVEWFIQQNSDQPIRSHSMSKKVKRKGPSQNGPAVGSIPEGEI